ncbi:hypothetical protein A9Q87_09650 [Flavobacteriales bacterium 34_180_T64]|nr:hypothetical protein A9Q87_09650 [Flavobacteriales bacterium 34_180_T64]
MEFRKVNTTNPFWLRPLQFEGTAMHPNVLLMCKLLVLLVVAHHFIEKIEDPFIPFIASLDVFHETSGIFKFTLRTLFLISALALFFNYFVRSASILLGLVIILTILSSKPLFANHTFVCGCALFLAGLTNNKQPPWLLFLQLSLIYLGASLNKILDVDWWSGAYMHNWLLNARANPFYMEISKLLPDMWFAKFLSWIAITSELLLGVLLLFKKQRKLAVWIIIIFHGMLFTITSFRFGHFFDSLLIFLLAFITWPKGNLNISYNPQIINRFKQLISFLDFDRKFNWTSSEHQGQWLQLSSDSKTLSNDAALKYILLYTPVFFLLLFILDSILYLALYNYRTVLFVLNVLFLWGMALFFLPIPWSKYFGKKH